MRATLALLLAVGFLALPNDGSARQKAPAKLSPEAINAAEFSTGAASRPLLIKMQVLLDRARFSPASSTVKTARTSSMPLPPSRRSAASTRPAP